MKILLAATGLLLSLASCSVSVPGIKSVNANEFEKLLQTGNIQLLDVRTAEEFAQGHIPGATNIDVQQPDFLEKAQAVLSRKRIVGIYCRSGKRSMRGAEILNKAKFTVVNLQGGIIEWQDAQKVTEE